MTRKQVLLIVLLAMLLAAGIRPVAAQTGITSVYVDTSANGNEDGTDQNPYNKVDEGRAYLQAQPYGGNLYVRSADGKSWLGPTPIAPAKPGVSGEPLPPLTIYILLGALSLLLILAGWWLTRRGRQLRI